MIDDLLNEWLEDIKKERILLAPFWLNCVAESVSVLVGVSRASLPSDKDGGGVKKCQQSYHTCVYIYTCTTTLTLPTLLPFSFNWFSGILINHHELDSEQAYIHCTCTSSSQ